MAGLNPGAARRNIQYLTQQSKDLPWELTMAPNNRTEDMGKEVRKLRKPVIEKMRRDRINSSIEQLRVLLEKEFQSHQLPSKPEKADILEMTVTFLRQQLHHATRVVAPYKHSFPLSMKDIVCAPHGKHLATQRSIGMDPQKRRAANESKGHPMKNINQVIVQQGAQECSSADLWRPCDLAVSDTLLRSGTPLRIVRRSRSFETFFRRLVSRCGGMIAWCDKGVHDIVYDVRIVTNGFYIAHTS
ncbi:unnamed protein product [Ranitomeya imitator]|uniref:BHLH domain-containing protein n=1 Tax=Ranitomeya imitator TaxID=111125 RepID=A0ABN9M687_9NEOB|nr:unnamed protein product [Ranitomeya imitator]